MTIGPLERFRQRLLSDADRAVDRAMLQVGTDDPIARSVALLAIEIFERDEYRPLTPEERYELDRMRRRGF